MLKSVRQKISASAFLFLLISSSITFFSANYINSIYLMIIVIILPVLLLTFVMFLLIKVLVINKIHLLQIGIDRVIADNGDDSITINTKDEFYDLALRLDSLVKNYKIQHKEKMETLLGEITNQENEKYLQNINDGLLFVDYGQFISDYYSKSLQEIFVRDDVGGQHLSDLIYPDKIEHKEQRKILEKFIISLFNKPEEFENITEDNNPLHNVWVSSGDGRRILIDGSLKKVEDQGKLVQIMIIFKDRTDQGLLIKKLDEKDKRSNFELESIISILKAGPGPFLQFIEESQKSLSDFRSNTIKIQNREVLDSSFRDIHSMKCSAAFFDFKAVEKLTHNLEDILIEFRKNNFSRKEALDIILDDLYIQFDHVRNLISRFQEFLSSDEGLIYDTHKNEQEHYFDTLKIMLFRDAETLGKIVDLQITSDFSNFPLLNELKNPIIHLLRNALDHGIELPDVRNSEGKHEKGTISLSFLKKGENGVSIIIDDDGSGINFEHLREIAVRKGFIKKDEETGHSNLIRTLFKSGFSYHDELTGLSGRGVGLNAVKEEISKLGGKITIKTEFRKGSRFTILLPPDLF